MIKFLYKHVKLFFSEIYNCFFPKKDKYDNQIFPNHNIKEPFILKYDGNKIFWCEWWTLYFYGNEDNKICGMINYIFVEGLNKIGKCIIYVAICNNDNKTNIYDNYKISDLYTDKNNIKINNNYILKKTNDSYYIYGESLDKKTIWNLHINRKQYESFNIAQNVGLGINNLENLSFVSIIPIANITGTLVLNGQEYKLDQYGEFEHLWGKIILQTITWNLMFGCDNKNNLVYWLHSDSDSLIQKGCVHLILENKKFYIRQYKVTEIKKEFEYPSIIKISCPINNIEIIYTTISQSASNNGSASENHVKIEIFYDNNVYILFGMAEYNKNKFSF